MRCNSSVRVLHGAKGNLCEVSVPSEFGILLFRRDAAKDIIPISWERETSDASGWPTKAGEKAALAAATAAMDALVAESQKIAA